MSSHCHAIDNTAIVAATIAATIATIVAANDDGTVYPAHIAYYNYAAKMRAARISFRKKGRGDDVIDVQGVDIPP